MKTNRLLAIRHLAVGLALGLGMTAAAQVPAAHRTENVIVVMMDGMRWQEIFRGADPELLKTLDPDWLGSPKQDAAEAQRAYGGATADQRRRALMPFLWSVVARQGQLFGNRDLGSDSHVTNAYNVSYPGYAETLTGIADPRVNSNADVPNPNPTVFAWLNAQPALAGKVAAFGAWSVFNDIFDRARCGFPVNAGYEPLTELENMPEVSVLNALKAETMPIWSDEPFDPIMFHTALAYLKARQPRVLFIGLGDTDDWAHKGAYDAYLKAAHVEDGYLRWIWELVQSLPQYRDKTTLIVLPDHGRGNGARWTTHGVRTPESRETWMAFLGPDTPALGERGPGTVVTESQIAATLAALLGQDYRAAVPRAGAPIQGVMGR